MFIEASIHSLPMYIKAIIKPVIFCLLTFSMCFDGKFLPERREIMIANAYFHSGFGPLLKCFGEYERFLIEGEAFVFRGMGFAINDCYLLYLDKGQKYKVRHYQFNGCGSSFDKPNYDTCIAGRHTSFKYCYGFISEEVIKKDISILSNQLFSKRFAKGVYFDPTYIIACKFKKGMLIDKISSVSGTCPILDQAYTDFLEVLESKK
jgi:hypothetical protein